MTTYKRNPKLNELKTEIKAKAAEGRALRDEARGQKGMTRWETKAQANYVGSDARDLLLAYGYLRGKKMEDMESPFSRPENLPSVKDIIALANEHFQPQEEESGEEYKAALDELIEFIKADFKAWRKTITMNAIEREALRRQRKAERQVA